VITAKVYLNEGPDWFRRFNPDTAKLRLAATFDITPSDDPEADLNGIFEQLNVGGDLVTAENYTRKYRLAGNRVGDVVTLGETAWTVKSFGWETITTDELVKTII
jgi:hypothetical protein